eukprot:jgi/Galph1/960/GphlegSOOS_G5645.1
MEQVVPEVIKGPEPYGNDKVYKEGYNLATSHGGNWCLGSTEASWIEPLNCKPTNKRKPTLDTAQKPPLGKRKILEQAELSKRITLSEIVKKFEPNVPIQEEHCVPEPHKLDQCHVQEMDKGDVDSTTFETKKTRISRTYFDNLRTEFEELRVYQTPNQSKESVEQVSSPLSRYQSPLRKGNWVERWSSVRALGASPVPTSKTFLVASRVKTIVSMVIRRVTYLSLATLEKWLTLMCDFIELNADEFIFFLVMLKKYIECSGPLRSCLDYKRPQLWESVLAVCAYFAVLLSEEFAGRTRRDLEDLWVQISISGLHSYVYISFDEYEKIRDMILMDGEYYKKSVWDWLGFSLKELDSGGNLVDSIALELAQIATSSVAQQSKKRSADTDNLESEQVLSSKTVKKTAPFNVYDSRSFYSTEETMLDSSLKDGDLQTVPTS